VVKSGDLIYTMVGKLINGDSVRDEFDELGNCSLLPEDVFRAMHRHMKEGGNPGYMLPYVDKVMNLVHKKLTEYEWDKPQKGTFLFVLIKENEGLIRALDSYRTVFKEEGPSDEAKWQEFISELSKYEVHLQKLENILFPELEKTDGMFDGLSMLWGMHDKARESVRQAAGFTAVEDLKSFNELIGRIFFIFHGLVKKQELILFPLAAAKLGDETMNRMMRQIEQKEGNSTESGALQAEQKKFTGGQDIVPLDLILGALPFDITFVDENDEVAFFSEGDRIFPRSASVIGRKVQNCHPPKSLAAVEAILGKFRDNSSSLEEFWIDHHGKKVLIRYIAVRDRQGKYCGTLEITQDITGIQKLEGEKRLL